MNTFIHICITLLRFNLLSVYESSSLYGFRIGTRDAMVADGRDAPVITSTAVMKPLSGHHFSLWPYTGNSSLLSSFPQIALYPTATHSFLFFHSVSHISHFSQLAERSERRTIVAVPAAVYICFLSVGFVWGCAHHGIVLDVVFEKHKAVP